MPGLAAPIPGAPQSKKPSLNMTDSPNPSQWLNFSLPPRSRAGVPGSGVPGVPRRSRRGEGWRGSALSRERFVHANFRFVLKPTEMLSYGAHFADPDISLHWPHILQVLVPTFSAFSVAQGYVSSKHNAKDEDPGLSPDEDDYAAMGEEAAERRRRIEEERRGRMCPICLSKPVAGRMTKCGHIFCFPCILHFIQLSDIPKSAKCPICGDTVHEGMLKSVKYLDASSMISATHGADETEHDSVMGEMEGFEAKTDPHAATPSGHRIHMRLIQRPQMTTLALPASPTWPSEAIPPLTAPWYFLPDVLSYSRFMLASPAYMLSELERELSELKSEWDMLRGDDLGRDFVRAAREKVERQIGKVKAELVTDMVTRSERNSREAWAEAVGGRLERGREARRPIVDVIPQVASSGSNTNIPPNIPVEPNPMPTPSRKSRRKGITAPVTTPTGPSYWFYQSSLGANVFLHPLDIRILLAHFKSYSLFPAQLSFTSTGFDPGTINDELRKRCKYLGHLPTGTEVIFVEADLEEIVGTEGLAAFDQPLKARREKRRARVKREDKAKTKWEKAERDKLPVSTVTSAEDRDFAYALARSTEVTWADEPVLGHPGPGSVGSHGSPGTSPTNWAHPQHPQPGSRTWASTLNTTRPVVRRDQQAEDWQVDAAWESFGGMSLEPREGETIRESEKGGGKKGKKGGKKTTLVLGGGGGRRA